MDKDIKTEIDLISHILTGGNHLANVLLQMNCYPNEYSKASEVCLNHGNLAADIWIAWRAIMDLSEYIRKEE